MDPIPLSPVELLQSSEAKRRSPPAAMQQVSEHFIHCQWKRPTSEQVSICQAPLFCSCVQTCMQGGRQGETHLKASQHLESSCWPMYYTLCSTGPVGTQTGRDKARK